MNGYQIRQSLRIISALALVALLWWNGPAFYVKGDTVTFSLLAGDSPDNQFERLFVNLFKWVFALMALVRLWLAASEDQSKYKSERWRRRKAER